MFEGLLCRPAEAKHFHGHDKNPWEAFHFSLEEARTEWGAADSIFVS